VKARNTVSILFVFVCGCVGARFYETAPVASQLHESLEKADAVKAQTERDFSDKRSIFAGIEKSPADAKTLSVRDNFGVMKKDLATLQKAHAAMNDTIHKYDHLIGARPKISSTDADWDAANQLTANFQSSLNTFNDAVLDYSRASGTMSSTITQNKLFYSANAEEVRNRLTQTIARAKKNIGVVDQEIKAAVKLASDNGTPLDSAAKQSLAAERNALGEHVRILSGILSEIKTTWGAKKTVSSKDPTWEHFRDLMAESDKKTMELNDIAQRIPAEIAKYQKSK
jgi:hypothetical protein